MNRDVEITEYIPRRTFRLGLKAWPEMMREIVRYRGLIWTLICRDLAGRFRQSFLGLIWTFLTPLVLMGVFVWIKSTQILPIQSTLMPYASFLFLGQVVWFLFSTGVASATNSLVESGQLLNKVNFPREVLVVSSLGKTLFDLVMRLPILFLVFYWTGFWPKMSILLTPVILFPLLLLIMGLGLWLAVFNALVHDVGQIVGIILSLGMFATPVFYPPPATWPFSFLVNFLNPVSCYLQATRDLASLGYLSDPIGYINAVIISVVLFLVSWRVFHLAEDKIAEKV